MCCYAKWHMYKCIHILWDIINISIRLITHDYLSVRASAASMMPCLTLPIISQNCLCFDLVKRVNILLLPLSYSDKDEFCSWKYFSIDCSVSWWRSYNRSNVQLLMGRGTIWTWRYFPPLETMWSLPPMHLSSKGMKISNMVLS